MTEEERTHATAARIQTLVDGFAQAEPEVRDRVRELVRLLMELYGAGLQRVLRILADTEGDGRDARAALLDDELLSSLLLLHDLHPEDAAARIRRGLERVRQLTGAELEVAHVDAAGAARVALTRARADARAPSKDDLRRLVEETVRAAAPEIVHLELDGLDGVPPRLVQLSARRGPAAEARPRLG